MDDRNGLILAGAVGKGAYHAGVLEVLAPRVPVASLVGTSAGALSAAVYAAGIATGRVGHAAKVIRKLWLEEADWLDFLRPSLAGIVHRRGVSGTGSVERLVRDAVMEVLHSDVAPDRSPDPAIEVSFVATDLRGHTVKDDAGCHTTFETVFSFTGADYGSGQGIDRVVAAATASAAFPLLFVPRELVPPAPRSTATPTGAAPRPYVDGGAVNNAPISYVLERAEVDRVFVVTAMPSVVETPGPLGDFGLAAQLADILINERLSRDLRRAARINRRLRDVQRVLEAAGVDSGVRDEVQRALAWKPLEMVEIRPERDLEGDAFAGFWDKRLRERYVQTGIDRANAVLR